MVFERVLIALDARSGGRDALVLGGQLTEPDGDIVVGAVLELTAAPLVGGPRAAAQRRDELRDAGQEVYATVGGDPRVRYVPLSGAPLGESVAGLARRVEAHAVVVGQDVARGAQLDALLEQQRRWAIVIAPYGHRFVRWVEPCRIGVAWAGAHRPMAELSGEAEARVVFLRSPTSRHTDGLDLIVVPAASLDAELARGAVCPILVPPSASGPWERRAAG